MNTYIIRSELLALYKIGRTIKIDKRVKELMSQTKDANLSIVRLYDGDLEKQLHIMFKHKRVRGEWFDLNEQDLVFIDSNKPISREKKHGVYYKILSCSSTRLKIALDLNISERTMLNWVNGNSKKLQSPATISIIKKHIKSR